MLHAASYVPNLQEMVFASRLWRRCTASAGGVANVAIINIDYYQAMQMGNNGANPRRRYEALVDITIHWELEWNLRTMYRLSQ